MSDDTKRGVIETAVDIVTGLIGRGNAEFGASLVAAAQTKNRENLEGQVVGKVQEFLVQLTKQRDYRLSCDRNIALLEAKVAAVKAGAFTLSTYGTITFDDPDLNRAVTRLSECPNCGYGAGAYDIDTARENENRRRRALVNG